jgi:chromosome segregation ATPase
VHVTDGEQGTVASSPAPPTSEPDLVVTEVVAAPEGDRAPVGPHDDRHDLGTLPPMDLTQLDTGEVDVPEELVWVVDEAVTTRKAAIEHGQHLASVESRLAALEAVPASVETLGRATRQELERCAGVLFGHDRALVEARERLDATVARLEALEGGAGGGPGTAANAAVYDQALARILDQLDGMARRLAAMEARVEPLEAVPTVVQALRRAVRASDDLLLGETNARQAQLAALAEEVAAEARARDDAVRRLVSQDLERMAALLAGQAQTLEDIGGRLTGAEARLAPLDAVPADIEALGRILRRELDALTSDAQARDQMLRRALQNEIDQIQAASQARDQVTTGLASRIEVSEGRIGEAAEAHAAAVRATGERLDALEGGMAAAAALGPQVDALRDLVRIELEQLRADAKAHDQLMGEITRKFAALDGRLARFDHMPGELQSLRTALRQEAERSMSRLRVVEERLDQLAWVPGEFQEARKRILALSSGFSVGQDAIRSLEAAVASTDERLRALAGRLGTSPPPA